MPNRMISQDRKNFAYLNLLEKSLLDLVMHNFETDFRFVFKS